MRVLSKRAKKRWPLILAAAFFLFSSTALAESGAVSASRPLNVLKPSSLSQAVLYLKKAQIEIERARKEPTSPKTLNYPKILKELSKIITTLEIADSQ